MLPLLAGLFGQVALWMLLLSSSRSTKHPISHSKTDLLEVAEAAEVLRLGGTSDRAGVYPSEWGKLSAEVGLEETHALMLAVCV